MEYPAVLLAHFTFDDNFGVEAPDSVRIWNLYWDLGLHVDFLDLVVDFEELISIYLVSSPAKYFGHLELERKPGRH